MNSQMSRSDTPIRQNESKPRMANPCRLTNSFSPLRSILYNSFAWRMGVMPSQNLSWYNSFLHTLHTCAKTHLSHEEKYQKSRLRIFSSKIGNCPSIEVIESFLLDPDDWHVLGKISSELDSSSGMESVTAHREADGTWTTVARSL